MKRKKRKAKQVVADEGFERGPLRMMRFGRLTVLQNQSTEEQHQAYMARLAGQYTEVCREIDELVSRIAETVARFAPLPLLHRAYWEFLSHNAGFSSETEAGEEANLSRLIVEYLHSMVCAVPPADPQKEAPTDVEWASLTGDVRDLYEKLLSGYFLTRSAWARKHEPGFDEDREEFSTFAQMMWVTVRGTRYLVHDPQNFRDLLSPHDDELDRLFGLTTAGILGGLTRIIRNLTRGHVEAIDEFERFRQDTLKAIEQYLEETGSTGEPPELMNRVIEHHGWQERRERVLGEAIGIGLFDMTSTTGWPRSLLDCLAWRPGEDKDFLSPGPFRGWPLRVLPIWRRPFLAVDGRHYCFGLYNLTDHGYRIFQRAILALDPGYRETWNRLQQRISEDLPLSLLGRLLPGATSYRSLYYRWFTGSNKKKQWCETDGLLIFDDHLIVIEVKAGAFTHTPPSTDFPAYLASLDQLLRAPADQTGRFCEFLESEPEVIVCDAEHRPVAQLTREDFRHVTRCCVTLDQLTNFGARSEHLGELGVDVGRAPVWTVSVDDLRVFADVLDNPLIFCHFLEERARAFRSPAVEMKDELDHLGLYLAHNHYSAYAEDFDLDTPVNWHGYRETLDRYFWGKVTGEAEDLPAQVLPFRLREILGVLSRSDTPGRCKAAAWVLDMGEDLRDGAAEGIERTLDEQEQTGRPKPFTITGSVSVSLFCSVEGRTSPTPRMVRLHTLATMQQAGERERMALELSYSPDRELRLVQPTFFTPSDIRTDEMKELEAYARRMSALRFDRHFAQTGKRKIGRNELCPCGSGRKYKKCCGSPLVRI